MTEMFIGTVPLIGVIILAIGCWFYMWGGRNGKWKRRFIGSFIVSTALWIEFFLLNLWHPLLLLVYPLTISSFILGYGSDITFVKIFKRSYIVAASLISSVGICFLFGGHCWLILPVEIVIAGITVWLGVKNPVQAAAEEYFVCLFLWAPKLMYPFALITQSIS